MFHYWQFNDEYYRPDIWGEGKGIRFYPQGVRELLQKAGLTKEFCHDAMLWYLDDWIEFELSYKYADVPMWMWNVQVKIIKLLMVILQKRVMKDIIDSM